MTAGTWSEPAEKVTVTYQWIVGDRLTVSGPTYTPVTADVGKTRRPRHRKYARLCHRQRENHRSQARDGSGSNAYAATYKVRTADRNARITLRVTGTLLGYTTASRDSGAFIAR